MNAPPQVGLLPLYLELYDQRLPEMRQRLEPFLAEMVTGLRGEALEVHTAPICCRRIEIQDAIARFERQRVDAIVTLHLAYSPSLEAAEPLARSHLPVVMCDTTPDEDFGRSVPFEQMLFNHGIHGVQDLASVLRRMGKRFAVAAGHCAHGQVLQKTADLARAACAARSLRNARVLRIGPTFAGMGDFAVSDDSLRRLLGITVQQIAVADLLPAARSITDQAIAAEMKEDRARYEVIAEPAVHHRSVRVGLAVRRHLERGGFSAFTMNFASFDSSDEPIDTVPFLEASKSMARGIGYAGEGDVVTAALIGALARGFGAVTFTEMFCPDWKDNALFLSHMGEINPAIASERPVICEKPFGFTGARNPAILACAPRPGEAMLVNLAPGAVERFTLLATQVEVMGDSEHPSMRHQVRGWIRPPTDLPRFLEAYSRLGGTHHCALVLGGSSKAMAAMADFAGIGFQLV